MLVRTGLLASARRGVVAAVIAGLAITIAEPPMAAAGSIGPVGKGVSAAAPAGGATDISARRRHYRGGNAAGLAIMGMMIGTMGAAVAAQQRRDAYCDYDGYGPGYYGPPPAARLLWTAGLRLRSPLWPPLLSILSLLGCNAGLATDHANDDKILRDPRPGQVNQGFRGRWQGENRRRFQSSIAECRTEHPVRAMQPDAKRARNTAVPTSIDVQNQREPPSFALEKILSKTCMD